MAGPDTEFGVQTSNLFSLLDDDAPAPAKKEAAPVKKAAPAKTAFNRGADRERTEKRPERSQQRGGGRGRGRGRGGRGGDSGPRGRAYDRRSGTGRDKSQPKNGHGKGNWGTDKDDEADGRPRNRRRDDWRQGQKEQSPVSKTEKADTDAAGAADAPEGEDKAPEAANATPEEEEQEKEPDTIGYEEFLAQKAAKAPEEDRTITKRAAENDETQWEACAEITKEEDDEESFFGAGFSSGGKKSKKGKAKPKAAANKKSLDEFNVSTRSTGRGRGRGRGRGGGYRGGRDNRAPDVRVDDKTQFPSLS